MPIVLVQSKTGSGNGATATVTLDSTPTTGNTLVAFHFARGSSATAPTGWELYQREIPVANTNPLTAAWRVVQPGDTGAEFTLASAEWAMVVLEYSGLLTVQADLLDMAMSAATNASSETVTTLKTTRTGFSDATEELCVAAVGLLGSNTWTGTWDDGFTQQGTAASPAATGSKAVIAVAHRVLAARAEVNTGTSWTTARRGIAAVVTLRAVAPTDPLQWAWVGAVTTSGATVVAQVDSEVDCRLAVSTSSNLTSPTYSATVAASAATEHVVRLPVTGLSAGTDYHWGVEVDGTVGPVRGRFTTHQSGAFSFTFALGSCGGYRDNGSMATQLPISTHPVWDAIEAHDPLFFVHMGDLHYQDVATTSVADHTLPLYTVLSSQKQGPLWRRVPIVHMYDDHDYCGNGSVGSAAGRNAAIAAQRRVVPFYPLNSATVTDPLHHAFTVGRVRFIYPDRFADSSAHEATDNLSKTRVGTVGRAWLETQLLAADADSSIGLIVLVTGEVWVMSGLAGWGEYTAERGYLGDIIDSMTTAVCGIAGDAHMVAIDDGTNNVAGGFPVFQAAALNRSGLLQGGPYSHGYYLNSDTENVDGQFGLFTVTDTGGSTITVDWSGRNVTHSGAQTELVSYQFQAATSPARPTYYSRAKIV